MICFTHPRIRIALDAIDWIGAFGDLLVLSIAIAGLAPASQAGIPIRYQATNQLEAQPGQLEALDEEHAEILNAGQRHIIPRQDLISIVWSGGESGSDQTWDRQKWWLHFGNGNRLAVGSMEITDGLCRFPLRKPEGEKGATSPPVAIPLETLSALVASPSAEKPTRLRRLLSSGPQADVVMLANGDQIPGELRKLSAKKLVLRSAMNDTEIDTDGIFAIAFNKDLQFTRPRPDTHAVLFLHDGSFLTVSSIRLDGQVLRVKAVQDYSMAVPLNHVRRIEFYGTRVIPLSTRRWSRFEFHPYLDRQAFVGVDQSWLGTVLSLRKKPFAYGLGVSSRSRITFSVEPQDHAFLVTTGLDDKAQGGGSVRFRILLDGTSAYDGPVLRGRDPSIDVPPIMLQGSHEITLVVDYADFGDIQDLANWVRPTVVKKQELSRSPNRPDSHGRKSQTPKP